MFQMKGNQKLENAKPKAHTSIITPSTSHNLPPIRPSLAPLCTFFVPSLVLPNLLLPPFSPLLVAITPKSTVAVFFVLVNLVVANVFPSRVAGEPEEATG